MVTERHSDPDEVGREYARIRPTYESFARTIEFDLQRILATEPRISVESISSRAKEVDSLVRKMSRHQTYLGIGDVDDLVGARIVLYTLEDVEACCDLIRREFEVIKDERRAPLPAEAFGYSSHHFVVKHSEARAALRENKLFKGIVVEIQVRTVLQHGWALISHRLDYKSEGQIPEAVRRRLFRVAALIEASDELLDQFRAEVGELRASYEEIANEQKADLSLNLDSLMAVWSTFDLEMIERVAMSAGFEEWNATDETLRSVLGELADVALGRGLTTIGAIGDAIARLPGLQEQLTRFVDETHKEVSAGSWNPPYCVTPFVVSVALAIEDDRALDVLAGIYHWIRNPIIAGRNKRVEFHPRKR